MDKPASDDLVATTTEGKYPEIRPIRALLTEHDESRRFRVQLSDMSWNHPFIDLWMLGQEWNRCLSISRRFLTGKSELTEDKTAKIADTHDRDSSWRAREVHDCLRLIFDRLLSPFSASFIDQFINDDGSFRFSQLYYCSADQLLLELERVLPRFGAARDVPELLVSLDEIVRLPVTGNSVFTLRISALADSAIVASARHHLQLAQVRQVFPGATHTRYEHLLGTVTTAAFIIRSLYLNDMNAFWRVSTDEREIRAALIAAVLHDSGHMAFGHFIEEMSDLMEGLTHEDYILALLNECLSYVSSNGAMPVSDTVFGMHKEEVRELVDILKTHWRGEDLSNCDSNELEQLISRVIGILSGPTPEIPATAYLSRAGTRSALDGIMRSIISGPIDADKLDYLRRDSFHAGVFFADGIDLERFFESLRACVVTDASQQLSTLPVLGISEKGIAPAETVITARYHLFSVVYWHRTVRCITALLQRVLTELRLALPDDQWGDFVPRFIEQFRRLDDQQSLVWLEGELGRRELAEARINRRSGSEGDTSGRRLGDLMEALLGDRSGYFRMAFELGYEAPVDQRQGKTPREQLHERICESVFGGGSQTATRDNSVSKDSTSMRERLDSYRLGLETEFLDRVRRYTGKPFSMDTILIDIPQPGKDQIKGLVVDRRGKRTRSGHRFGEHLNVGAGADFVDITLISPIAATLSDVFTRWARRVRIYMTDEDLAALRNLGLDTGDVAGIWEDLLCSLHNVDTQQPELRFD